ncbi:hypothetical protein IscW_ISCW001237, partial [Ixodes scapularis]
LLDPLFLIRLLITVACVAGFTYQATDFFIMYFKFPTTTNIRVESMKDLVFPAFTSNGLLLVTCRSWYKSFVRYPDSYCYTLDYSRIKNDSHPLRRCRYPWDYEMNSTVGWDLDRVVEVDPFGADASVHEHDTNSAEQAHSLFFEPHSRYIILVEQQTTLALPKPYQTKCVNYEAMKRSKKYYGMMTQNLCYERCRMELWLKKCGCISSRYAYRDLHGSKICDVPKT